MIENVATLVITFSSFLLFAYWFRYACRLILTAKPTHDYAGAVATANQLDFPKVKLQLRDQDADLDRLKEALDRDYEVLVYLLRNTANPPIGEAAIEKRMLEIYYQVIRTWYRATNHISPPTASSSTWRDVDCGRPLCQRNGRACGGPTVDCLAGPRVNVVLHRQGVQTVRDHPGYVNSLSLGAS